MRLALAACLALSTLLAPSADAQVLDRLPSRLPSKDARAQALAAGFAASAPPTAPVRAIAEFERSEAVVVSYSTWIDVGDALPVELIALLSEQVRVISLHNADSQKDEIEAAYAAGGVAMDNVEFFRTATDSPWTRDYGPFYVADGDGQIGIVDFIYDVAGRDDDNTAPAALAGYLDMPLYTMDLVHTGGNYMVTGAGSAASTDRLTEYNDGDETRVRQQMQAYLGIEDYFIFPDPQATYIDHIDTWGKFLDVDKILIAQASPGHPDYAALEAIAAEFAATPSPWGTPYQVIRVFAPNRQPYTNSLIVNDHVYVATGGSGDASLDADALQVYRDALPGYTIHGVDYSGWLSTDALHCRTKEVADTGMLSVRHTPLPAEVPAGQDLTFEAEIIAYSGMPVAEGSANLVYTIDGGAEGAVPLEPVGGATYRATLSAPPAGAEVAYYLTASDTSGRTETFPFVGAAAPRTVTVSPFTAGAAGAPTAALALAAAPNPVAGRLAVRFTLPAAGTATLDVVDALGRTVAKLHDGPARAGENQASWAPRGVAPGVYLVRLTADGARAVQRVTVAR